jgi:hypothetical protein
MDVIKKIGHLREIIIINPSKSSEFEINTLFMK